MKKLTIYIARYKSSTENISGHSAPCSNCLCKIKQLGIKKIVYVDSKGTIQKCLSKNYTTEYMSVGYKVYRRLGIKVN
jgi:deoxycytidylate deaminase